MPVAVAVVVSDGCECPCPLPDGNDYSAYYVIFRRMVPERKAEVAPDYQFAVNFAIVDVANQKYYTDSQLEKRSMDLFRVRD